MLLHEGNPTINSDQCLEFSIPGFARSTGRIEPWSSGFKTFLIRSGEAVASTHCALKIFPRHDARALPEAVGSFLNDIPPECVEYVSDYDFPQCHLLQLLARYEEARDLSRSNPSLLWIITTSVFDSIIDAAEIPALLRKRQVDILRRIVSRASKASLKLLRKVDVGNGGLTESRALLYALSNQHFIKVTAHLPGVPVALLRAMVRYPSLADPAIARIITAELPFEYNHFLETAHNIADTVKDIYRMAEALRIDRPQEAVSRCRTLQDLEDLHDRWVDRVNLRGQLYTRRTRGGEWPEDLDPPNRVARIHAVTGELVPSDWEFPDPPFPDSREVKAVRTPQELAYEGKLQKNCVASYTRSVIAGDLFIYKVLRPHRATLELRRTETGWDIGQLKLSGNRVPSAEVRRMAEEWFASHNIVAAKTGNLDDPGRTRSTENPQG